MITYKLSCDKCGKESVYFTGVPTVNDTITVGQKKESVVVHKEREYMICPECVSLAMTEIRAVFPHSG